MYSTEGGHGGRTRGVSDQGGRGSVPIRSGRSGMGEVF